MAVEGPVQDQMPQDPVGPPRGLIDPHRERRPPLILRHGAGVAAVVVDDDPVFLARRPKRLPVLGVQRRDSGTRNDSGQQDAAPQAERGDLLHAAHGAVEVGQEDLADTCPALG